MLTTTQPADCLGRRASPRKEPGRFVFSSSRLGILGSIAVSVVVTLILLVVFRVFR